MNQNVCINTPLIVLIKENCFMIQKSKKVKCKWCSEESITDADYADDYVLLVYPACSCRISVA